MNVLIKAMTLALSLSLQACASITAGTTQSVAVDTTPVQQATCTLQNEKGQWSVVRTPGATTVTKAYGPLTVQCKADTGHAGSTSVSSTTGGAVFGNIIAGGIIGAAVDMGSGAAYAYPAQVLVPMATPVQPIAPAPVATLPVPTQVVCRLKKVEELRDKEWCRNAGGKVIPSAAPAVMTVAAPTSVSSPAQSMYPAPAPATPPAISPLATVGNCYLLDGRQIQATVDTCTAHKGFIGG
ncbi:hypothetical protein GAY33_10725 [Azospirillum brasilense]|uniref:hypothetical protein n=1 Tax=Azospirillum argentinense TaxID=2970906 RepID=UPI0019091303|nr:hypothetical protein [Azospirillum argentinense]MBK3799699.1 hypothetical protein [Azospirillum argentinense]